jgi:translation initiation factor IF-2
MSETAEKKKKVHNVAKDLNLSHDTVVAFLKKKGYEVKGIMSPVDDEMMRDLLHHFKKEKETAEKHQRKVSEMRETKKKVEKKAEEVTRRTEDAHRQLFPRTLQSRK